MSTFIFKNKQKKRSLERRVSSDLNTENIELRTNQRNDF